MKSAKDGFSRFHLSGLWWQSTTALLFLITLAAHAQQTWTGNFSSLWNSPFNWNPPGVPTGTAIFGQSNRTMITSLLPSTIGTIQFNQGAPAYTISPFFAFAINGGGIVNNSSNAPTLNVGFSLQFFNASTASNATIVTQSLTGLQFFNNSTAGNATIITENLGLTRFFDTSTGGQARFVTDQFGLVDISDLSFPGMSAGSIEGAGTYFLGSKELMVGLNNLSTTVSGLIAGDGGSLVKVGTGTLTLTGNNLYSGGTTIEDGTLVVGTPSAAQTTSFALGMGNVFLAGGTLRTPSLDPITINIGRNYTQGPGGTLALGVAGVDGKDYDHVQVQRNASLGGTLAVSSLNNFRPVEGNAFEVLHTGGSRSGQFAHVNDSLNNNPNLQRIDVYARNGVALVYVKAVHPPIPPQPPTPPPGPPPLIEEETQDLLPPVDPDQPLPASFLLWVLDPSVEQLTSLFEIAFSGANTQRFELDERFADIQRGLTGFVSNLPTAPAPAETGTGKSVVEKEPVLQPRPQNRWGLWANGWGDWVSVGNDGVAKGYNFTTGGFILGVDYRIADHFAIGLTGSYAYTSTNLQPSGDIDVNTGRGGLYATYFDRGFYLNGAAYGGHNSYNTSRQELQGMANGSTSGGEFSTFGEAEYDFHLGSFTVGPLFSIQYTLVHIDRFNEQGSLLPLQIHSDSEASLRTDLGVRASYAFHIGKVSLFPSVTAAWEHEYFYTDLPITVSSPNFPEESATLFGPNEGHDSVIVNAGLAAQLTSRISTYVGYQGQLARDHYNANGVSGGISFSF